MKTEIVDAQLQQRVWQRVQGTASAPAEMPPVKQADDGEALGALIVGQWELAAAYLQLSRRMKGRQNAVARQLAQQAQSNCACLKGIYRLATGTPPKLTGVVPSAQTAEAALRQCYGRQMQSLAAFEQWAQDRRYGYVFGEMARQAREACHSVLELIGNQ